MDKELGEASKNWFNKHCSNRLHCGLLKSYPNYKSSKNMKRRTFLKQVVSTAAFCMTGTSLLRVENAGKPPNIVFMPTVVEISGATYPIEFNGRKYPERTANELAWLRQWMGRE